jgi:putative transposase
MDYYEPLQPECIYHIYNRGNNKENIFYQQENYSYFLKKLSEYVTDYIDIYAYCLLPNHFHLLARVKKEEDVIAAYQKNTLSKSQRLGKYEPLPAHEIVSEQFRLFFMSYSKAINKQEKREGSLFRKNFKRIRIASDLYFTRMVWYIHNNPVKHRICKDFTSYRWSSYQRILLTQESKLDKKSVLEWFGGVEWFKEFHLGNQNLEDMTDFLIED